MPSSSSLIDDTVTNTEYINIKIIHEIHNATPPVAGIIPSWDDLSLGTANTLNLIDNFLTTSSKNHVIIMARGIIKRVNLLNSIV